MRIGAYAPVELSFSPQDVRVLAIVERVGRPHAMQHMRSLPPALRREHIEDYVVTVRRDQVLTWDSLMGGHVLFRLQQVPTQDLTPSHDPFTHEQPSLVSCGKPARRGGVGSSELLRW